MRIKTDFWTRFICYGFFLAVTLALRLKAIPLFNSAFIGGTQGDGGLYVWLSYSTPKALLTLPWFSTQAFYPYQDSLAFSDNFILPSLLIQALRSYLGVSFPASYNLVMLTALFLNGICTAKLVQERGGTLISGLLAGTAIESFGFLTAHSGHPQLQFLFWIPLGLLFWLKSIDYASPERSIKYALFAGFSLFLSLLCSVYYAIFLLTIYCLTTVFKLFLCGQCTFSASNLKLKIKQLIPSVGALALSLIPSIPFALPYLRIKNIYGERGIHEAFYFSASPLSFISSPPLTAWGSLTSGLSHSEAWLFPGLTCLMLTLFVGGLKKLQTLILFRIAPLALIAMLVRLLFEFNPAPWGLYLQSVTAWIILIIGNILIAKSRGPDFYRLILFLALNTAIISLGPLGNPAKDHLVFSPYMAFKAILPGLEGIRAISRIGVVTVFCLAIIAGLNWGRLVKDFSWRGIATFFVLIVVVLENINSDVAVEPLSDKPLAFHHLPNDGEPMITLPLVTAPLRSGEVSSWSDFAQQNVNAMLWTMDSNHPTANGYSGLRTPNMLNYPRWLRSFPSDESVKILKNSGIRYIVYLNGDSATNGQTSNGQILHGQIVNKQTVHKQTVQKQTVQKQILQKQQTVLNGLSIIFEGEDGSQLYRIER